jgi:hypothetical protein
MNKKQDRKSLAVKLSGKRQILQDFLSECRQVENGFNLEIEKELGSEVLNFEKINEILDRRSAAIDKIALKIIESQKINDINS